MKVLIIGNRCDYIENYLIDYMLSNLLEITVVDSKVINKNVKYIKDRCSDLPKIFFKDFTNILLLNNNIRDVLWLINVLNKEQKFIYINSNYINSNYIDKLSELYKNKLQIYGLQCDIIDGFNTNGIINNITTDIILNKHNNNITNNVVSILGIHDLARCILTIIYKGNIEKSGLYNLQSFNSTISEITKTINTLYNKREINQNINININIDSCEFEKNFEFEFKDTLEIIIYNILDEWFKIVLYYTHIIVLFVFMNEIIHRKML